MTTYSEERQRKIVFLLALVQFVNVLDFVMVMPLGPAFAKALHIPSENLGLIGGVYTAAACISGLLLSFILDRFDRKKVLLLAVSGLALTTFLGGLAWSFRSLLIARVLAGILGGPATSMALAIVSDVVPIERRGKAIGSLMASFSIASILGIPMGLELAKLGSWRAPFFGLAGLALIAVLMGAKYLPSFTGHLRQTHQLEKNWSILKAELFQLKYALSLIATGGILFTTFLLVPHVASYLEFNLNWPHERLSWLYLIGGLASFFSTRYGGAWGDSVSLFIPFGLASLGYGLVLLAGFIFYTHWVPIPVFFTAFMFFATLRNVSLQTLISRVPVPAVRGRFMSLISATQHLMSAAGAMLSSVLLSSEPSGRLIGIPRLALVALLVSFCLPYVVYILNQRLKVKKVELLASAF